MKSVVLFLLVAAVFAEEQYSTENDDLDVEAVVNNDETLKAFHACFMDTAPCNDVQASFKKDLAEAVQLSCSKCTPAQKHILRRFLEVLKVKFPQDYTNFQKKYDPEVKYFTGLETEISNA